ncbi:MAG: hypothetical protein GY818_07135 [Planctomycetaceae bacterium]|nr:hypothetical protein [Planctomycetaceae bacterium]
MRINNPLLTILTCLTLCAMLILTNQLWDTQVATADGISPTSLQEGRFNPIQEEEEREYEEEEREYEEEEREYEEEEREYEEEEGEYTEDEHDEGEHDEEEHFDDRENEHREIEATLGRLEVIRQLAEIAENDTATAAYALMQMEEVFEEEDQAIEVLNQLLSTNPAKPIKNLIRMKLVEAHLWSDQTEEATEVLIELIKD